MFEKDKWLSALVRALSPLAAYHRVEVEGEEHWPDGPALLISNHSGGASLGDALWLVDRYRRLGTDERVVVLAHDFFFQHPALASVFAEIGVVRACRENALKALREGRKVLVFPGSDIDSLRPFHARKEVRFGGHEGFLRLAQAAQVPIVPIAQAGTHETLIVLSQGLEIARQLGIPRWARWHSFPVTLTVPFGLTVGPFAYAPYWPLPSKIQVAIGEALAPPEVGTEMLASHYQRALDATQGLLDGLYARRRWPIIG